MDENRKYPEEDPELDLKLLPLQRALLARYSDLSRNWVNHLEGQEEKNERMATELIRALGCDEISGCTHNLKAAVKTLRKEQKDSADCLRRLEQEMEYLRELKRKTDTEIEEHIREKIQVAEAKEKRRSNNYSILRTKRS